MITLRSIMAEVGKALSSAADMTAKASMLDSQYFSIYQKAYQDEAEGLGINFMQLAVILQDFRFIKGYIDSHQDVAELEPLLKAKSKEALKIEMKDGEAIITTSTDEEASKIENAKTVIASGSSTAHYMAHMTSFDQGNLTKKSEIAALIGKHAGVGMEKTLQEKPQYNA